MPTTQPSTKPGEILILGGTGFLGPHQVRYALARGHKVTIANRGRSRPELFDNQENVDEIVIDREGSLDELEQAIKDGRKWDAVIDNTAYVPAHVTATATLLKDATRHYQVISSISVYGTGINKVGADESYPVEDTTDEEAAKVKLIREVGALYGPLKYRSERAALAVMGADKTCAIRPGLIAGPGDSTDRFTYWPVRVGMGERCGGKMLLPGTDQSPQMIQIIDVRDLAEFCIHCCEQATSGDFNAVAEPQRLSSAVRAAWSWHKENGVAPADVVMVSPEFLTEQGAQWWQELPGIVPSEGDTAGFATLSNAAAAKAGMTFRTIADTTTATLDWWKTLPADRTERLRAGMNEEREQELLDAWATKK